MTSPVWRVGQFVSQQSWLYSADISICQNDSPSASYSSNISLSHTSVKFYRFHVILLSLVDLVSDMKRKLFAKRSFLCRIVGVRQQLALLFYETIGCIIGMFLRNDTQLYDDSHVYIYCQFLFVYLWLFSCALIGP